MDKIAIFGAGGFGREVLEQIHDINNIENRFEIVGFFDDDQSKKEIHGYPLLGGIEEINKWETDLGLVVAIGTPRIKKVIIERIKNLHISYPTIIHPSVMIGDRKYVKIGKGCIICPASIITTDVIIGDFVTLNLACTVGHDTTIKDYSAFMPTCNISGEVVIGESVYCGTGTKIINQKVVHDNVIIGAGAVVVKDIPANTVVAGVPARFLKYAE